MTPFDDHATHDDDASDLTWLAAREPRLGDPTDVATARARQALLDHAQAGPESLATTHTAGAAADRFIVPAPRTRRRRAARGGVVVAGAAIAAIAVTIGVGSLPQGNGPTTGPLAHIAPNAAQAAPLIKLTDDLGSAAPATGDATLTVKHTKLANGTEVDGYDLVTDAPLLDYFSQTRDGIKDAQAISPTGPGTATGVGSIHAWLAAAAAAANDSPADAAKRINAASGIPIPAAPAGKDPATYHQDQFDNHVWITALSAIELDGGRPDVRGGALLAMYGVGAKINQTTDASGRRVIEMSIDEPVNGSSYTETLTIDAVTGTPISFSGGATGKTPDTAITYDVSRVKAADFGH